MHSKLAKPMLIKLETNGAKWSVVADMKFGALFEIWKLISVNGI